MFNLMKLSLEQLMEEYTGMKVEVQVSAFSFTHVRIVVGLSNYVIPIEEGLKDIFYNQIPAIVTSITDKAIDTTCSYSLTLFTSVEYCENPGIVKQDGQWKCLDHFNVNEYNLPEVTINSN